MREERPGFDELVEAEARRLLGLAHALTGDPHDAWDLTQETLARVGERWTRIHGDAAAYARTVMVRLNVDRVRHLRRVLLPGTTPEHLDHAVPAVEVGALDPWLVDGLATLSPRQRTALALRYVEDLDVAGIADRVGCSPGTAKSHLSRGTARLQAHAAAVGVTSARTVPEKEG